MASFLVKTEPSQYSFADLVRDGRTVWDGVSNPLALSHLRKVRKGDSVVVYHSGSERQAVGLAVAASNPYPDPKRKDPKLVVVDLEAVRAFARPVPLSAFKADPLLKGTDLARLPRLSVLPLTAAHLRRVLQLAKG